MAKTNTSDPHRINIDLVHTPRKPTTGIIQRGQNAGYALSSTIKRAINKIARVKHVSLASKVRSTRFQVDDKTTMVTYNSGSGADGKSLSKADHVQADMPILQQSTKRVGLANGGTSRGKHVTKLPFPQLSPKAAQADSFNDFPTFLMSVDIISDNDTIFIFTRDSVTVHKEQDGLIACKGGPTLIGV